MKQVGRELAQSIMGLRWTGPALAIVLLVTGTLIARPRPLFVWNVSASAPRGLYFVGGVGAIARGNMVVARVPAGLRILAARRGYLPMNVPLVKRVVAVAGDRVCAVGAEVRVNGRIAARRIAFDARGRAMPWWSGCVDLVEGDYFFIMQDRPTSFDGRYFGVSNARDLLGKATLLWRR